MGDCLTSKGIRINVSSLKMFLSSGKLTKDAKLVAIPCQRYNNETGWQYPFTVKLVDNGVEFILKDGEDHLLRLVSEKVQKDFEAIVRGDKVYKSNLFNQCADLNRPFFEYDLLFGYESDLVNEDSAEGKLSSEISDLTPILSTPTVVNGCTDALVRFMRDREGAAAEAKKPENAVALKAVQNIVKGELGL